MPDAARLLAEADGFEAPRTLADSMHAFQALAAVAAGHADAAAVSLVHFTLPDAAVHNLGDVNTALVGRAVERIQSPLVGYAFALALEATLDSLSPRDTKAVVARSRQAQAAYRQTAELLKSLQLAGRYPHLVELTRQMGQRLAQADYFVGRAATLRRRGDLDGATRELLRGLRRNPASAELWQAYAQARLDRLKRQQGDADFDDLLAEIDAAARQGLVADYQRQVIHGAVHEERGQEQAALAAYLRATRAAANAEQKVFAQSKAGALRARVAMAVRERE